MKSRLLCLTPSFQKLDNNKLRVVVSDMKHTRQSRARSGADVGAVRRPAPLPTGGWSGPSAAPTGERQQSGPSEQQECAGRGRNPRFGAQQGGGEVREKLVVVGAHGLAHAECIEDKEPARDFHAVDHVRRGDKRETDERGAIVQQFQREGTRDAGGVAALAQCWTGGLENLEAKRSHLAA